MSGDKIPVLLVGESGAAVKEKGVKAQKSSNASSTYNSVHSSDSEDNIPLSVLFGQQTRTIVTIPVMTEVCKVVEHQRTYMFNGGNINGVFDESSLGYFMMACIPWLNSLPLKKINQKDTDSNCDTLDKYKELHRSNAEALSYYMADHLSLCVLLLVKNCVTAYEMHKKI